MLIKVVICLFVCLFVLNFLRTHLVTQHSDATTLLPLGDEVDEFARSLFELKGDPFALLERYAIICSTRFHFLSSPFLPKGFADIQCFFHPWSGNLRWKALKTLQITRK